MLALFLDEITSCKALFKYASFLSQTQFTSRNMVGDQEVIGECMKPWLHLVLLIPMLTPCFPSLGIDCLMSSENKLCVPFQVKFLATVIYWSLSKHLTKAVTT